MAKERTERDPLTRTQVYFVYLVAALCSSVVMALELLGTRVVGSFYGTSVYVWASLISVTLVAIAAGYAAGGAFASRVGRFGVYYVCALAGLAVAVIPSLSPFVLRMTNGLGARLGALTSAALLFFVPIAVLSTVGPMSIGMLVRDASRSGRISGMLLAISTAGSVAGTLVLAFVLLPAVRVTHVFAFCAAAMFLVSVGSWLIWRPRRARGAPGGPAVLIVAAAIAWLGRSGPAPMSSRFQVLRETENLHGRLRVVDDEEMSIRWLVSDSSLISASRLHESRPVFEYLNLLEVLIGVAPDARRALVIGLGAGYVPRRLEEHGLQVDSIEINPAVADAAREFFGFRTSGKLIIGDARYELRGLGEYDVIIHDCFSGGSIPPHVLSLEMMREIRAHLRKGGVLMTSFFGDLTGPDSTATKTIHRTLKEVFPQTKVLVPKRGAEPIDVAFVGSDRPIALDPAFVSRLAEPRLKTLAAQFGELEVQLDDSGLDAATDDLNPFDMLQASKAEQYRNLLVERLGIEFFL